MRSLLLLLWACGRVEEPAVTPDDTVDPIDTVDTVVDTDLPADTDPVDVDTDPPVDTEPGVPLPGYGLITGDCGVLDDAIWTSPAPVGFRSALDLGTTAWDPTLLSPGAQEMLDIGTLGGSSIESEALSFDLLYRCELATLLKGEPEVLYDDPAGKKTDILVEIDGRKVGVSVTRALTYDNGDKCAAVDEAAIASLISRKVGDLALSQANAAAEDAWERSMLYVIACDEDHAAATLAAFDALDVALRGDAVLVVTSTQGEDAALY